MGSGPWAGWGQKFATQLSHGLIVQLNKILTNEKWDLNHSNSDAFDY